MPSTSLRIALDNYLQFIAANASENTLRTYAQAIRKFFETLKDHKVDIDNVTVDDVRSIGSRGMSPLSNPWLRLQKPFS